jgi:hypothetical protein
MRRLALLAALAASLHAARAISEETCGPLFVIERSRNANVVLYEAVTGADGTLDRKKPVRVTWRLDAEDGRREGLNIVERIRAYGVDVEPLPEHDAWRVKVRALPTRPLVLRAGAPCPQVITIVGGRDAILRRVFVTATPGLIPSVLSVELSGVDLETARPVTERFIPSR